MGYGKNLERILKERNTNVRNIANQTGISPTTLYSAIQRDAAIKYVNACKIYRALSPKFDMRLICDEVMDDDPALSRTSLTEYLKIGEKMKNARMKAGLQIQEAADLLNLSPESYDDFENGYRQPHAEILLKFCSVTNITMEELLGMKIDRSSTSTKSITSDYKPLLLKDLRSVMEVTSDKATTVIVMFDGEKADKNLEINVSHPILDRLDNSEVVSITVSEGSDKKPHIAICLRD